MGDHVARRSAGAQRNDGLAPAPALFVHAYRENESNRRNIMRSLVTGGAGFIGSHVARHCLELNQEVVVLDDLSGGFRDQVPAGAEFVEGSVTDAPLVAQLFERYRFDYVYHLAAYAAEGRSHFILRFNYTNNLIGSVNLINAA